MKGAIQSALRALCTEYQLNRIYCVDLPPPEASPPLPDAGTSIRPIVSADELLASPDARIRDHAWYVGEGAHAYGVFAAGGLVALTVFWIAGHPRMPARFAGLDAAEAVMVDLLTAPQCRGKGYALAVTRYAEEDLFRRGFRRLWTWVWHSNAPSIRVFRKAGWSYSHFLAEFRFRGTRRAVTFKLPSIRD